MLSKVWFLVAGVGACLALAADEGYPLSDALWKTAEIPVCWENGSAATATEQGWVQARVNATWANNSGVIFTGWGNCTSAFNYGIRILISDEQPYAFALGSHLNNMRNGMVLNFTYNKWGCVDVISKQTIPCNYSSDNPTRRLWIESTGIHEFGHALGLSHEQNRPDRPAYCAEPSQGWDGDFVVGAWDALSIMNYCNKEYNNNALSPMDITTIQTLYPKYNIDFNGDFGTDIGLVGGTGWASIPTAQFSTTAPTWGILNSPAADFASWAQQPNVKALAGRFNRDGRTDIALVGGSGWRSVPVAFRNSDGSFQVTNFGIGNEFTTSAQAQDVKPITGDFNGDGLTDIALVGGWGSVGNWQVPVALSRGDGTFDLKLWDAWDDWNNAAFQSWVGNAKYTLVDDFNGDGLSDIALFGGDGWKSVPVAFALPGGGFKVSNNFNIDRGEINALARSAGARVFTGEFNGDGKHDIIIVGGSDHNNFTYLFSDVEGFIAVQRKSAGTPWGNMQDWANAPNALVAVGDFDRNGLSDVAITGVSGLPSIPVAFSQLDGSLKFTNNTVNVFPQDAASPGAELIVGDFNHDGRSDLALIKSDVARYNVPLAISDGTGGFKFNSGDAGSFAASWAWANNVRVLKPNKLW